MSFPLSIFYFTYLILAAVCLLFILFNAYIMLRFGFLTVANILIIMFFIGVALAILVISWSYIGPIDWQQTITLQAAAAFPY